MLSITLKILLLLIKSKRDMPRTSSARSCVTIISIADDVIESNEMLNRVIPKLYIRRSSDVLFTL